MFDRIASDESLQVLLFLCLPLTLLLILIIAFLVRRSRRTSTFQTFSVSISRIGREETRVTYRDQDRCIEFDAETKRGRSFFVPEIRVQVPLRMPEQDVCTVVPNLVRGLADLHYQYLIYRKREPQVVPEEERVAAVEELRRMGVEIQSSQHLGKIQRAVVADWRKTVGNQAKVMLPKLLALMSTATGFRENIEVLAQGKHRNHVA
jgi:hypothetical protein